MNIKVNTIKTNNFGLPFDCYIIHKLYLISSSALGCRPVTNCQATKIHGFNSRRRRLLLVGYFTALIAIYPQIFGMYSTIGIFSEWGLLFLLSLQLFFSDD